MAEGQWPLSPWWECQSLPLRAQVHQLWWSWGGHVIVACAAAIRAHRLSSLFSYLHSVPYQYVLCTWIFLWRLSMCCTTSSPLASRRAPVASFSRPRQGINCATDLLFIPSIILERTGSTEEMDLTPDSSVADDNNNIQVAQYDLPIRTISNNVWCTADEYHHVCSEDLMTRVRIRQTELHLSRKTTNDWSTVFKFTN